MLTRLITIDIQAEILYYHHLSCNKTKLGFYNDSTAVLEARVALSFASSNSYASFILSNLPRASIT